MDEAGAALRVRDARELTRAAGELLTDPVRRGTLIESAASYAGRMDGVLERTAALVLEALGEPGEAA